MSRRLAALVIGNAAYEHAGTLKNPKNDAEDIAAKLAGCGFTVSKAIDCSILEMDQALKHLGFEECKPVPRPQPTLDEQAPDQPTRLLTIRDVVAEMQSGPLGDDGR